MIYYEARPFHYKIKIWKPTPEEQAIIRRRGEEARKRAYEELRKRYGD